MAINKQVEFENYFHNFRSGIYTIRQTVDKELKEHNNSERRTINERFSLDLYNIKINLSNMAGGIEHFITEYAIYPEIQKEAAIYLQTMLEESREMLKKGNYIEMESRIELLNLMEAMLYKKFGDILSPKPLLKLRLNAPKNVIYHLIQQLKNSTIQGNTSFLPQTYNELAEFLIHYVEGFENDKLEQLTKELTRKTIVKKRCFEVTTKD